MASDPKPRAGSRLALVGHGMIPVTHLNGQRAAVNPDLIEIIDETPDTVIHFVSGNNLRVRETRLELIELIVHYRRSILAAFASDPSTHTGPHTVPPYPEEGD